MGIPMSSEVTYIGCGVFTFIASIYFSAICSCMFCQVRLGKIPFATDATILFVIALETQMLAVF